MVLVPGKVGAPCAVFLISFVQMSALFSRIDQGKRLQRFLLDSPLPLKIFGSRIDNVVKQFERAVAIDQEFRNNDNVSLRSRSRQISLPRAVLETTRTSLALPCCYGLGLLFALQSCCLARAHGTAYLSRSRVRSAIVRVFACAVSERISIEILFAPVHQ